MHPSIEARSGCRADRGWRRLRSERGGMLVEVMMSALLVAIAATAVFKGIDGANATSGQSKSRAVAANLAHEDQERLRAMDPRDLASYNPQPTQKVVNRIPYTITSSAQWVSDRGEAESCTKGDGRVIYVRITSSVTWPEMQGSKPVSASSIVAISNAYAKGSLAVKVVDRNGTGIEGIPVTIDELANTTNTNGSGCVVHDGLNTGIYHGQFSRSGYVDMLGANVVRPVNGFSVTVGATSVSTHAYDVASSASFHFVTSAVNNAGTRTEFATTSPGLLVKNPQIPYGGARRDLFGSLQATRSYTNLFPFASGYTAFPVACDADAPTGNGAATGALTPGQAANAGQSIKVNLPSINPRVTVDGAVATGTTASRLRIRVRPATGACGRAHNWGAGTTAALTSGEPPMDANRGFTPGEYVVCADLGASGSGRYREERTIDTRDMVDEPVLTLDLDTVGRTTSPTGSCP